MKFKAIIFDIDGTLTTTNSWNVLTEKLGADTDEHHRIYLARKSNALSLEQARKLLINLWAKTGNANETFIRNLFKKTTLRPEAKKIVDYLKSKNYLICLITGSNNILAEAIAKKLKVDYYYANCIFNFDRLGNLVHYDYEIEQGKHKLDQLKDFCKKSKLKISDCAVVGDSANDVEIFKATGNGVAVKTDQEEPEIESVAWKIVPNLLNLKDFL